MGVRETFETTVEFLNDEDRIRVFTNVRRHVNAMTNLCAEHPDDARIVRTTDTGGIFVECPAAWFRLPYPPRVMSEESRAAAAERCRKMRERISGRGDVFDEE